MGIELRAGSTEADPTPRRERRAPWALRVVALPGLIVALQLGTAWARRWTTDDAFIIRKMAADTDYVEVLVNGVRQYVGLFEALTQIDFDGLDGVILIR